MEQMVTSAVVQEAVSGAVSFVFTSRGEKVSQEELMERLEMAHIKLDLALERTRIMPINIISLLRLRKKFKDVFKECDDLLSESRDHQKVVPSLRRKIMHSVLPSFIVPSQGVLSSSVVRRFEWFAKEADKFVKDVESGCTLCHHRFLNPLIRHLLEGKDLVYRMVQGSQTHSFGIWTASVEEYGRVAKLDFRYIDRKVPLKRFRLVLALRLHESTNIVGVTAKCLQSLGPQFKSFTQVAMGELTQVPAQDVSYTDSVDSILWENVVALNKRWNPDPFCCIANGLNKHCSNNIISSELRDRFPREVVSVAFHCCFSASEDCSWNSMDQARVKSIKAWPPLEMLVALAPHVSYKHQDGRSLHQTEEGVQTKAINYFIRYPKLMEYDMIWRSAHGCAAFHVSKPIAKTRRASKRGC